MRADALARSMMNNNMTEFWKHVKKNSNSNISLATNVDGSVRNTEIAEMWKCHYKSPLNSVQNKEFKKFVMLDTNQQHESSITITPFDILDALKSISVVNLAVLMTFPQNTLYLFIVAFTFYYPCYFLHLLHMLICQICS